MLPHLVSTLSDVIFMHTENIHHYNNIINVDKHNFIMTSVIFLILQYFWSSMKWFKVDKFIEYSLKITLSSVKFCFGLKKLY